MERLKNIGDQGHGRFEAVAVGYQNDDGDGTGVARDVNKSLESSSAATACSRVTEGKWSMKRSKLSPAAR